MKIYYQLTRMICVCMLLMIFSSCKKQNYTLTTTTDVNIMDYLRRYPDQFSEFVKVLERAEISSFLNAYGAYTCFAPTNDAFKLYLQQAGKKSTDEIDTATLKNICRLHLIQDTIRTTSFTDGKLYTPTMYGQYLITGVNGGGSIIVNRQAVITQPNILTGNGYVHVIDHVLLAATLSVAQTIEQNTKYSIFSQALKATGLYDSLNSIQYNQDGSRKWSAILAESDSVLNVAGITSYTALKNKYNNTGNPKRNDDSLYLYMAYHILTGIKYIADIVSFQSHPTMAPLAVITTTLDGQKVLLNQAVFNGVFEPGVLIDRNNSDVSATNGVVHTLLGDIFLKIRTPVRVDFDIAAQPEIIKLTSIYRKAGKNQTFSLGQLADVTWQNANSTPQYTCEASTGTNFYWWDDHFDFNMRYGNPAANNWVEFTTPLIVKGKYKVWVCFRKSSNGQYVQVSFDGRPTSKLIDFFSSLPTNVTGSALEAIGYKKYSNDPLANNNNYAMLAGIVDVSTTDRHKIRFTCVKDQGSGAGNTSTVDFIQFIPVDQDQQRPVYGKDGTITP